MCEEIPMHYKDGDIVWVKLDLCWWPGKVIDFEALPEDYQDDFRPGQKRPLVVVSFFQEKHFEYVMNLNRIYSYNCSKKDEFIKRALDLIRNKRGTMDKFPDDIKKAEELTGGNEDILSDPKYAPQKRNSWTSFFGTPKQESPQSTGGGRGRKSLSKTAKTPTSASNSPSIAHSRFGSKNDTYQVRMLIQNRPQPEPAQQKYSCDTCDFETNRIDVIIIHKKAHMEGRYASPAHSPHSKSQHEKTPRKSQKLYKFPVSKTNTIDEDIALLEQGISLTDHESDCDEELIEVIKVKSKRKSKGSVGVSPKKAVVKKKPKVEVEKVEEKKDIRVDLLAEWDDDEEEETSVNNNENLVTDDKSARKKDTDTIKGKEIEQEKSITEKSGLLTGKPSTDKEKEEDKSCFDFDDEDDNRLLTTATTSGRKIPRVIPEKRKSIEPTDLKPVDDDFEEELNKFTEVLESTTAPITPELPPTNLKCEQNFHYSKAKKSPDKPKIINLKKRFVKSFEDFEQSVNVEMDESGVESIKEIEWPAKDVKSDPNKQDEEIKDEAKETNLGIIESNDGHIGEEMTVSEIHDEIEVPMVSSKLTEVANISESISEKSMVTTRSKDRKSVSSASTLDPVNEGNKELDGAKISDEIVETQKIEESEKDEAKNVVEESIKKIDDVMDESKLDSLTKSTDFPEKLEDTSKVKPDDSNASIEKSEPVKNTFFDFDEEIPKPRKAKPARKSLIDSKKSKKQSKDLEVEITRTERPSFLPEDDNVIKKLMSKLPSFSTELDEETKKNYFSPETHEDSPTCHLHKSEDFRRSKLQTPEDGTRRQTRSSLPSGENFEEETPRKPRVNRWGSKKEDELQEETAAKKKRSTRSSLLPVETVMEEDSKSIEENPHRTRSTRSSLPVNSEEAKKPKLRKSLKKEDPPDAPEVQEETKPRRSLKKEHPAVEEEPKSRRSLRKDDDNKKSLVDSEVAEESKSKKALKNDPLVDPEVAEEEKSKKALKKDQLLDEEDEPKSKKALKKDLLVDLQVEAEEPKSKQALKKDESTAVPEEEEEKKPRRSLRKDDSDAQENKKSMKKDELVDLEAVEEPKSKKALKKEESTVVPDDEEEEKKPRRSLRKDDTDAHDNKKSLKKDIPVDLEVAEEPKSKKALKKDQLLDEEEEPKSKKALKKDSLVDLEAAEEPKSKKASKKDESMVVPDEEEEKKPRRSLRKDDSDAQDNKKSLKKDPSVDFEVAEEPKSKKSLKKDDLVVVPDVVEEPKPRRSLRKDDPDVQDNKKSLKKDLVDSEVAEEPKSKKALKKDQSADAEAEEESKKDDSPVSPGLPEESKSGRVLKTDNSFVPDVLEEPKSKKSTKKEDSDVTVVSKPRRSSKKDDVLIPLDATEEPKSRKSSKKEDSVSATTEEPIPVHEEHTAMKTRSTRSSLSAEADRKARLAAEETIKTPPTDTQVVASSSKKPKQQRKASVTEDDTKKSKQDKTPEDDLNKSKQDKTTEDTKKTNQDKTTEEDPKKIKQDKIPEEDLKTTTTEEDQKKSKPKQQRKASIAEEDSNKTIEDDQKKLKLVSEEVELKAPEPAIETEVRKTRSTRSSMSMEVEKKEKPEEEVGTRITRSSRSSLHVDPEEDKKKAAKDEEDAKKVDDEVVEAKTIESLKKTKAEIKEEKKAKLAAEESAKKTKAAVEETSKKAVEEVAKKVVEEGAKKIVEEGVKKIVEEAAKKTKSADEESEKKIKSPVEETSKKTKAAFDESFKKTKSPFEESAKKTRTTRSSLPANFEEHSMRTRSVKAEEDVKESKAAAKKTKAHSEESSEMTCDDESATKLDEEEKKLAETPKKSKIEHELKKTRSTRSSLHEVGEEVDKGKKSRLRSSLSPDFKDEAKKPKLREKTRLSLKDTRKLNEEKAFSKQREDEEKKKQKDEEEQRKPVSSGQKGEEEKKKSGIELKQKEGKSASLEEKPKGKSVSLEDKLKQKEVKPVLPEEKLKQKEVKPVTLEEKLKQKEEEEKRSTSSIEEKLKKMEEDTPNLPKPQEEVTFKRNMRELPIKKKIKPNFEEALTKIDMEIPIKTRSSRLSTRDLEETLKRGFTPKRSKVEAEKKEETPEKMRTTRSSSSQEFDLKKLKEKKHTLSGPNEDVKKGEKKKGSLDFDKNEKSVTADVDTAQTIVSAEMTLKDVKNVLAEEEIDSNKTQQEVKKTSTKPQEDVKMVSSKLQDIKTDSPKLQDVKTDSSKLQEVKTVSPELQDANIISSEVQDVNFVSPELQDAKVVSPEVQDDAKTDAKKGKKMPPLVPVDVYGDAKKKKLKKLDIADDEVKMQSEANASQQTIEPELTDELELKKFHDEENKKLKSRWSSLMSGNKKLVVEETKKIKKKWSELSSDAEREEESKKIKTKWSASASAEIRKKSRWDDEEPRKIDEAKKIKSKWTLGVINDDVIRKKSENKKVDEENERKMSMKWSHGDEEEEVQRKKSKLSENDETEIGATKQETTATEVSKKSFPSSIGGELDRSETSPTSSDKSGRRFKKLPFTGKKTWLSKDEENSEIPTLSENEEVNKNLSIIAPPREDSPKTPTSTETKELPSLLTKMKTALMTSLEESSRLNEAPEAGSEGPRKIKTSPEKQYINKKIKQRLSRVEESPPKKKPHLEIDFSQTKKMKTKWSPGVSDDTEDDQRKKAKLSESTEPEGVLKVSKLKSRLMDKLNESEIELQRPKGKIWMNQKPEEKMERLQRRRSSSAKSPRRLSLQSHEISIEKTSENTVEVFRVEEDVKKQPIEEAKIESILKSPGLPQENDENSALNTLATISELSSYDLKSDIDIEKNLTVVSESDLGDTQVEIAKIPIMEEGTVKATTVASFSVDFTEDLNVLENKKRVKPSESEILGAIRLPPPVGCDRSTIYAESSKILEKEEVTIPSIPTEEATVVSIEESKLEDVVTFVEEEAVVKTPTGEETVVVEVPRAEEVFVAGEAVIEVPTGEDNLSIEEGALIEETATASREEDAGVPFIEEAVVPTGEEVAIIVRNECAIPLTEESVVLIEDVSSSNQQMVEVPVTVEEGHVDKESVSVAEGASEKTLIGVGETEIPITAAVETFQEEIEPQINSAATEVSVVEEPVVLASEEIPPQEETIPLIEKPESSALIFMEDPTSGVVEESAVVEAPIVEQQEEASINGSVITEESVVAQIQEEPAGEAMVIPSENEASESEALQITSVEIQESVVPEETVEMQPPTFEANLDSTMEAENKECDLNMSKEGAGIEVGSLPTEILSAEIKAESQVGSFSAKIETGSFPTEIPQEGIPVEETGNLESVTVSSEEIPVLDNGEIVEVSEKAIETSGEICSLVELDTSNAVQIAEQQDTDIPKIPDEDNLESHLSTETNEDASFKKTPGNELIETSEVVVAKNQEVVLEHKEAVVVNNEQIIEIANTEEQLGFDLTQSLPKIQENVVVEKVVPKSKKIDVLSDVKLPDTRNILMKKLAIPPKKLVQKKFMENSVEMEMAKLTDTKMDSAVVSQPQESTTSTKLLEILTDSSQSLKIANPRFELGSSPAISKPKTKLLIRSSIPGGPATTKSMIISEKVIRGKEVMQRRDSEGIDAFVIRKKEIATKKKAGIFKAGPSTSSDDNVFDIDSMPIVLTDQILTPENIDNVPIMIQQEKPAPNKMKLLNKSTPSPINFKEKLAFRTQKTLQAKQGINKKVLITPAEASGSGKYTLGKRIIKRTPVLPTTSGVRIQEPTGNKIMIVTNNQGQQSRVVITPAQQKILGYQGFKKVVKKTTPNILSQTIINPKGQIKTSSVVTAAQSSPVVVRKKIEPSRSKILGQKLSLQSSLNQLKPGQQRTIIIKNPQGQTVKKIQGTNDALLEKQVQEQIQAINRATWSQNVANKQQPVSKKFIKKSPPVVSESTKLALQHKAQSSGVKPAPVSEIPPLSPLGKKSDPAGKPKPVSPRAVVSEAEKTEKADKQRAPHQLVIQDALGNQTTITEGQILALPSETVDGQPQSYMLVTLDETGNLTPLNNEALMSLDPNLNLGGDLSNMVLQIDQSGVNAESPSVPVVPQEFPPQEALPVPQEVAAVPQEGKLEEVAETPAASSLESSGGSQQTIACAINNGETNQQLIITGDPASTQKFLESLSEGNADLANLLANAEGNILIHADGQQILINTDADNQMLLQVSPDGAPVTESNEHSGNPIFSSPAPKNQDILAAALADTDVFQQEQSVIATKPVQSQLSPTVPSLYPINVNNVLETSSMNSPIMTPLEVRSTNTKKIEAETDILTQVPKNVDLPITITDPNISQTVAHQQAALMSSDLHTNLDLPLAIQDVTVTSAEMSSPSFGYTLPSLDESVDMQKPFSNSISMPLLTEIPEDVVTSTPVPVTMEVEIPESATVEETVIEEPLKTNETTTKKTDSQYLLSTSALTSISNQMCSSLSEPPPDMFDFTIDQGYDIKQQPMEISPTITESPVDDEYLEENDKTESESEQASNSPSTNSTDSCEIPVQPEIELRNYEEDKL